MNVGDTVRRTAVGAPAAAALAIALAAGPAYAATPQAVDDRQHACPPSRVPDAGFTDIAGDTFQNEINCIADYGITKGVSRDRYAPQLAVSRQDMATFVYRFLQYAGKAPTDTSSAGFTDLGDVPQEERDDINALAHAGVVRGVDARHFDPHRVVRRDEMASFIVRAQSLVDNGYPSSTDYFSDDNGDVHEANINAIAQAGIAVGTSPGHYSPAAPVTRSEMAGFLARDLEVNIQRGNITSPYPQQ